MTRASWLMLALVVVVVDVRVASAQAPGAAPPDSTPPLESSEQSPASQPAPPPDLAPGDPGYHSPGMALGLSLGFTLAGAGLISFGYLGEADRSGGGLSKSNASLMKTMGGLVAFVGPTTGHIYAGKTWNRGLKWRLITLGAFAVTGTITAVGSAGSKTTEPVTVVFGVLTLASVAGYLGATTYEIATAPRAAREHNRRPGQPTITVAPTLGEGLGFAVLGTF